MTRVVCILCGMGGGGEPATAYNCHGCGGKATMRPHDPELVPLFDLWGLKFKDIAHYNGGKAWFGNLYRCVAYERLTCMARYDRKTRRSTETWRVDDVDQPDLAHALIELSKKP